MSEDLKTILAKKMDTVEGSLEVLDMFFKIIEKEKRNE